MQENIHQAPEGVVRPSLDDEAVIKDLLRAHAIAVFQRLNEATHKNVPLQEVVQADQRAAAFIASTLLGNNPSYEPAKVNTPEIIERNLRASTAEELKNLGLSEKDLEKQLDFMQAALYVYTNQIHELINYLKEHQDAIESEGPQKLDSLLTDWSDRILGKKNGSACN